METLHIDSVNNIATLRQINTIEVFEAVLNALVTDPDFKPGMGLLADRRNLAAPTTSELKRYIELVRRYKPQLGTCPWAVVTGDMANFGMVRMGSTLGSFVGIKSEVFKTEEEALEWLKSLQK